MNKLFDLNGKVAVITGGGGVLGGEAALSLFQAGAKVIILDRSEQIINEKKAQIEKLGASVNGYVADVLSEESLLSVRKKIVGSYGSIDILLNAAGGNMPGATIPPGKTIFDLSMDDFNKVNELNLNGTVLPSIIFGKVMAEQGSGSIVNYSSMTVSRVITRVLGYSTSKAAVENFTRWMAVEMASKFGEGIRVNAIAPGFFIGNQNRTLLINGDGSYTERGETIIRNTPMGRFGQADELNGAILYLCSNASKFVTGITIPIDGGFSAFSGV
ncbi:SDR family oxidoreductase [Abyssalbus ytuae]|uniref:SDR family oxidoreductase n=1 Tax=Abyssalbus ytuae TaxID=2926907 RepID=A0A9E7D409_9FLAO|nr:SDR family oxidoreductase [Abyssalbus ytuae]UOB18399.1 SDR family oxidoreductase [Abyssalbus ytuae]